jgi:hypothetical protein
MNANKGISSVFSVSYRDEKIRNKLLDLQFKKLYSLVVTF